MQRVWLDESLIPSQRVETRLRYPEISASCILLIGYENAHGDDKKCRRKGEMTRRSRTEKYRIVAGAASTVDDLLNLPIDMTAK